MTEKRQLNEMLDRPVVDERVLNFMRHNQGDFPAAIHDLEMNAHQRRVPIIPHETAVYLDFILGLIQPKEILEVGMAIGFSASLMVYGHEERHVDTIDRYDLMINEAKENFSRLGVEDQVTILEGDAVDILPQLDKTYDFIFMDSAKAKYYDFFPHCIDHLRVGGVLMIDDIFQGGTVFDDLETIPKRVRKIHKKLNLLLDEISGHPDLKTSVLPLGDGVLMVQKQTDKSFHYMLGKL